jgi:hypothetical protein
MGASHQRAGHQTRLALDGRQYFLTVDMRSLIRMTGPGHSRRFGDVRIRTTETRVLPLHGMNVNRCGDLIHSLDCASEQGSCASSAHEALPAGETG